MSWPAGDVRAAGERLRADRRPFVSVTVIRAERPTSAKAGDTAVVLDDGTIVGFVGGECAQANVQVHALAALERGEPLLLRISPDAPEVAPESPGAHTGEVTVHNPCLSGGALEIFLEPVKPPALVVVHGDAPIARAVRDLSGWLGYDTRPWADDGIPPETDAVVVASHGGDERTVIESALRVGVPYIGLVASPRRAGGVLAPLELSAEDRERVSSPAGLDIGSRSPQEVALSILAEIVARRPRLPRDRRVQPPQAQSTAGAPKATDPVCGMTVAAVDATRRVDHDGTSYWFCGSGCEDAFRANPAAFLTR